MFTSSGGPWSQSAEFTNSYGASNDLFSSSVALSGTIALAGAPDHNSGYSDEGEAYFYSTSLVQPQGSVPGADTWGGGSPSEPCASCSSNLPASWSAPGETVNPITLDLSATGTDLTLPGAGVPLQFTRTYDAFAAQNEVTNGSAAPALGFGWSDNLAMTVAYNTTTQIATVTEENGAQVSFSTYVSGTSPAWCNSATNFCSAAPRIEATLNHNGDGTWTFTRTTASKTVFSFNTSGVLTKTADASGDTVTSGSYSPGTGQTTCPTGTTCTAWTSSASGRELVLAVNSSGRLTSLFDANSALAASFAYSGSGCTSWSGGQTADLCTATDPGNLISTYTYTSTVSTAAYDYNLYTETQPGASAATWNWWAGGNMSQQEDPSGAYTLFSWGTSTLAVTDVVIHFPLGTGSGEPEDMTLEDGYDNVMFAQTTGYGTTSAATSLFQIDPVSLLPLWSIDGNGNTTTNVYQSYNGPGGTPTSSDDLLTATAPAANATEDAYNSNNQVWCAVDAADYANGARCPSSAPSTPPAPGASDPNPGMTISFYNTSDQLTAATDALGNTTTNSYTSGVSGVPNGLLYCSVDPDNYQKGVACPVYRATHVAGTATESYDSYGDKTSYTYGVTNLPGAVASQTDPDGTVTNYSYNAAGEVTTQTATFGSYSTTTSTAYDSLGRQYCQVTPYEYAKGVTCPASPPLEPAHLVERPLSGCHHHHLRHQRPDRADHQHPGRDHLHSLRQGRRNFLYRRPVRGGRLSHLPLHAAVDSAHPVKRPLPGRDDHHL